MPPIDWEKKREVIRHYDELAPFYDSLYSNEQNMKFKPTLEHVSIQSSDKILDVGCGSGFLFKHIAFDAACIVGVDISMGLLKVARAQVKSKKLISAYLVRADADYLPFQDMFFNKVFAFTLLQNVPDLDVTLDEMTRVAKENAEFVVSGLKKAYSEQSFRRILAKVGFKFKIIEASEHSRDIIAVCHRQNQGKK
jgi:ubiquinone/menaquinone biosynthesis C-methylase UbiE